MSSVEIIGYVAGALTTFSASPQLYYSYTTKDVRSIDFVFMSMLIAGLSTWTVYGFFIGALPIIAFNAIGALLWLPIYILKIKEMKNRSGGK